MKTNHNDLKGVGCLKKVVLSWQFLNNSEGFKLIELAPGISVGHIFASTEATLIMEGEIPEMVID